MSYALIINNAVAKYPYSFAQLCNENPQISFPREVDNKKLEEFNVYKVHVAVPSYDPLVQDATEVNPTLVNGVWTQTWAITNASANDIALRQQTQADTAAHDEVKIDAFVNSFLGMTPTQAATYVENNTATLAATRALLKKMAAMLLVLAKREFH